jgi:hypothetical protein
MTSVPNFMKIPRLVRKLLGEGKRRHGKGVLCRHLFNEDSKFRARSQRKWDESIN